MAGLPNSMERSPSRERGSDSEDGGRVTVLRQESARAGMSRRASLRMCWIRSAASDSGRLRRVDIKKSALSFVVVLLVVVGNG